MIELRKVATAPELVFDVALAGAEGAPPVLMLHGFAVSRHIWDTALPVLAEAGYRAAAPSQRGYSPGARPDPAVFANYDIDLLLADALALADAVGGAGCRFHLAGHDWGGSLAWEIAARWPARVGSLAMFSRPHPMAFARALREDPGQPHRSRHHKAFLAPDAAAVVLADDCAWLRTRHAAQGMPLVQTEKHLSVLGNPAAMEAALAWYRARGTVHRPIGNITVPTLYVWGEEDDTVGRMAAEGTRDFIDAPYTFAALPGVGHYPPDQVPDRVNALLIEHLRRHPL
ncbi:MAG: alpha/beta hydrolase [Acetobacteraceae bacterium]|nr:alpha/beta hydrolase [Acetobacteraceae bacterium]